MNWFTDLFKEKIPPPPEPVAQQEVGLPESETAKLSPTIREEVQRMTELARRSDQNRTDRSRIQQLITAVAETDLQHQQRRRERRWPGKKEDTGGEGTRM